MRTECRALDSERCYYFETFVIEKGQVKASQQLMATPMAEVITLWRGDEGERDRGGERSREHLCMPKIAPACFMELAAAYQQLLAPLRLSSFE